jgi:hypothetical protein
MPQMLMKVKHAPLGDVGLLGGLLRGALLEKLSSGEKNSEENDSGLAKDRAKGGQCCKVREVTKSKKDSPSSWTSSARHTAGR